MKKNAIVLGVGLAVLLLTGMPAAAVDTMVGFDDVTTSGRVNMPEGYAGLNWQNFGVAKYDHKGASTGYYNANVSGDYVAFNHFGSPAELSRESPFVFEGAYFTAAWRDNLQIDVEGYLDGSLLYTKNFTVDTQGPIWVPFDWDQIDLMVCSTSGGEPVGFAQDSYQFAMDDMVYHTPAPGAALLAGLGAGLAGWLRRRKCL